MLLNFPVPYPDELFYSLCARYGERTGYPDAKTLNLKLFGSRNALAVVDLPNHLEHVFDTLPGDLFRSARDIVNDHTLLPFYRPFLSEQRAAQIEEEMRLSGSVHHSTGIVASKVRVPGRLRYCPVCVEEDIQRLGEPYWHRLHQLPGVEVCPRHRVFLEESEVKTSNRQSRHIYVSARAALKQKTPKPVFLSPRSNVHHVLLSIARDAAWILEQPVPAGDLNAFRIRYRLLLAEREYATYSGRIRMGDLFAAFKAHYSDAVLERLQCPLPNEQMDTWLHRLLRHPKAAHHPIRHFLVMRFLGHAAQTFFSLEAVEPFSSGPWLCLNQASNHYKIATIEHLETHYTKDRGKPVGTFRCPQCGFTYQRTGPDKNEGDRYRIDRMVDFGSQWLRALQALQTTEVSLREKARRLGVTTRTVQRYEEMLRAEMLQKQVSDGDERRDEQREKRKRQREAWRQLQETHSTLSVTQLRTLAPGLYMWLYRNDQAWFKMFNQRQPKLQLTPSPRRVDWAERDRTFAASVISVAERLRRVGDERPQRMSAAALAREFGRVSVIQQHLDKLPLTARALDAHVETRETFALRRIAWAVRQCRKRRQIPKYWQLARLAGLRPDMLAQPEVDAAVKHAVVELAYLSTKVTVEDG